MLSNFPKKDKISDVSELGPISIIPSLSKVLEQVGSKQVRIYVDSPYILPMYQSGFREKCSTVTVLRKIIQDIHNSLDSNVSFIEFE